MNIQDLLLVIGALATIAASWGAARLAGKSSVQVAEINADEGAFLRAEKIYQGAIHQLEKENSQLRQEVEILKEKVDILEQKAKLRRE